MAVHYTPTRRADEVQPVESRSWTTTRSFYPLDQRLRLAGFVIHGRPRRGPDTWTRSRVVFTADEARELVEDEEAARGIGP